MFVFRKGWGNSNMSYFSWVLRWTQIWVTIADLYCLWPNSNVWYSYQDPSLANCSDSNFHSESSAAFIFDREGIDEKVGLWMYCIDAHHSWCCNACYESGTKKEVGTGALANCPGWCHFWELQKWRSCRPSVWKTSKFFFSTWFFYATSKKTFGIHSIGYWVCILLSIYGFQGFLYNKVQ